MVKKIEGGLELKKIWTIVGVVSFLILFILFFIFSSEAKLFLGAIKLFLVDYWWFLFPFPLWYIFKMLWGEYNENLFLKKFEYVVLELTPPDEIEKSPKLMEHVFAGLNDYSTPNRLEINCGWRVLQPKLSFEIAGDEGRVKFFIRCPVHMRDNVEAQIYAHYPDIKIMAVEDYVNVGPKSIPNNNWEVWGATLNLVKPDPVPIRTYKHFQEEVTGKMIDPLSNMIEVMNSLPKNQHIWFQIIIISEKEPNWHPASEAYIQSIIDKHMGKKDNSAKSPFLNIFKEISLAIGNAFAGLLGGELSKSSSEEENNGGNNKDGEFNAQKLPPGEQEKIKAIYDNLSKPSFLTVIRFIYFGTKDGYNKALGVAGLMGMTKQLSDVNLNALIPSYRTKTFANYYFDQERLLYRKRKIVADYRGRSISGMYQIMNTEELATIFHFPDLAVKNLERAQSKKEDAPVDLPTTDTNSTIVQENLANLSRERDNIGNLDTENKIVDKDKIFKNIGIASISTNNHSHSAEDLKENLSELPQPFSVNKKIDDNIENFEKQQTDSSEDVIEEYIEPTEEYIEPTEEYVEPTEENFNNDRDMTIKEQITANNVKSQNKISKSYEVNCSACGVITTVNFKPDSIRPVFCANCLREHRRTQSKLKEVQRQGKEDSNNKVKNKQESFSKNISPQKSKIIITKNKKTVKSKNEIDSSAVQKIIQDAMIDK